MKIKEMINKIYKAFMSKEEIATLEAKATQEEEEKHRAFVAEHKQQLVPLSHLAQTILDTVKARLDEGQATCERAGVVFSGRMSSYTLTDLVAKQTFHITVYARSYYSRVRGVTLCNYHLTSPIALPEDEGNTLACQLMEHWDKVKTTVEAKRYAASVEQELQSLTSKYMSEEAPVTKE